MDLVSSDIILDSHLLFLIYHCSSNPDKHRNRLFAYSILMLNDQAHNALLPDSTFTLPCYEIPSIKNIRIITYR